MQKSHKEQLAETYKEFYRDIQRNKFEILKLIDNIIVWFVGLATGAIVLIFSSYKEVDIIDFRTKNILIVFLLISIVAGLLGRLLYAWATRVYSKLESIFYFVCSMEQFPHSDEKLKGNETSEIIYQMLQENFKIDYKAILEDKNKSIEKDKADERARVFYNQYKDYSEFQLADAIKRFGEIIIESFGYKDDYFENKKSTGNKRDAKLGRFLNYMSLSLLLLSLLFFLLTIILFVLKLLQH